MEKIIAMLDESEAFAQMFCNYVNSHRILPFQVRAFTDWEAFLVCADTYDIQLILASDLLEHSRAEAWKERTVWLSEKPSDPEKNIVNRYQGAERLSKEIISRLGGFVEISQQEKLAKLTVFYAPFGGGGQTTAALAYTWAGGQKRRMLYVNLEAGAGLKLLQAEGDKNLSDALYYYLETPEDCRAKLVGCTLHRMELHFIPPTNCYRDLEELEPEVLIGFLEKLRDPALYDEVVIDLGGLMKEPLRLLSCADRVVVPLQKNQSMHRCKWNAFEEYLKKSVYTDILNHLQVWELPFMEDLFGREVGWDGVAKSEWTRWLKEADL